MHTANIPQTYFIIARPGGAARLHQVKFEFDPKKSAGNKVKHGIDFIEAQAVWAALHVEVLAKTGAGEQCYAVLGKIGAAIYIVIITNRGATRRIIAARPPTENEARIYEQKIRR